MKFFYLKHRYGNDDQYSEEYITATRRLVNLMTSELFVIHRDNFVCGRFDGFGEYDFCVGSDLWVRMKLRR